MLKHYCYEITQNTQMYKQIISQLAMVGSLYSGNDKCVTGVSRPLRSGELL